MTVVFTSGWEVSQVLQVNQRCVEALGPDLLLLLAVFHPSPCADTGALSDSSVPLAACRPWGCSQPLGVEVLRGAAELRHQLVPRPGLPRRAAAFW